MKDCESAVQPLKARAPTPNSAEVPSDSPSMVTDARLTQPLNASGPIALTLAGIVMEVSPDPAKTLLLDVLVKLDDETDVVESVIL